MLGLKKKHVVTYGEHKITFRSQVNKRSMFGWQMLFSEARLRLLDAGIQVDARDKVMVDGWYEDGKNFRY